MESGEAARADGMERSDSDFEDDDGSGSDLEEEDSDDEPREEEEEADCPTLPSDGEDSSADEQGGPEVAGSHDRRRSGRRGGFWAY